MERISVVGLGKLGMCAAACFAAKGFEVTGVDINKDFVESVNSGKAPVYEPGLQRLISSCKSRLTATQDYNEAIKNSDMTFLVVPTPSRKDGHFSDKYLKDALRYLSRALGIAEKKYHLFVITSTVSPGTTDENLIPLIEAESGKQLNKDFGVCYNPEFIALGSVIRDFLNPDMVLVGESNNFAGERLAKVYEKVCENKPYIARMSIMSAEITKISLNSYITMKISFANTLANICEKIPSADVDAITKALGADKRIAPFYLKGGLSYGGPCFPRDNKAFVAFAEKHDVDAVLAKATDAVNQLQIDRLIELAMTHFRSRDNNNIVSVLGFAYKPNTPVIEESPVIRLIEEFLKNDLEVIIYDPLAMDNVRARFGENILYASSVKDCFFRSSMSIITTQADEFKSINEDYIVHKPTTIIDCWRIIEPLKFSKKVNYIALGKAAK